METLRFEFPATRGPAERRHVGVVASGDLEVLVEPALTGRAEVRVRTSVTGFAAVWSSVLERFFARHPVAGRYELNDAGATPAVVALRLLQAIEPGIEGPGAVERRAVAPGSVEPDTARPDTAEPGSVEPGA